MSIARLVSLPFVYKPWRSPHLRLVFGDILHWSRDRSRSHQEHLTATLDWLCQAQDQRAGAADAGSVSAGWSFEDGWLPGYPETTGYIIETFLAAASVLARPDLIARAQRMLDWELSIQEASGAFPGHFGEPGSRPVVFNTGQIMHGMLAGYTQLGRPECLEAAVRAGHWLVCHQDPDGCWRTYEHHDTPHVYNTRATWALLATGIVAGEAELVTGARRNLDWALSQQTASGWFASNAFVPGRAPFTHTIAYAIRGLLESGLWLGDGVYLQAAERAARPLMQAQHQDGGLAGTYRDGWLPAARYCCLTGVAQMAINWLRLAQVTGDVGFQQAAQRGIGYLKGTQRLDDPAPQVRGGIAGSYPIWGAYSRFEFPNWAAKFFADALMMDLTKRPIPPVREVSP